MRAMHDYTRLCLRNIDIPNLAKLCCARRRVRSSEESGVLCGLRLKEQYLTPHMPADVPRRALVARSIQHGMWRAALRTLTTTSSPPRGVDQGRPDICQTCSLAHSTPSRWSLSSLAQLTRRVRLHDGTHQKVSHTSLSDSICG